MPKKIPNKTQELINNLQKIVDDHLARVKEIKSSGKPPKPAAKPLTGRAKQQREQKLRRNEAAENRANRLKIAKDMREPSAKSAKPNKPPVVKPTKPAKPSKASQSTKTKSRKSSALSNNLGAGYSPRYIDTDPLGGNGLLIKIP